jgi:methylenetetrahydrofolate dehydrogenase (NADP+) / methenyltetrahydrofolate cyclohydrolase
MAIILNGKELAKEYKIKIKEFIDERKLNNQSIPCLAAVLVGDDGGSVFYVNSQKKVCEKLGVEYKLIHLKENTTEEGLIHTVEELNNDISVSGIILQLPLPKHISSKKVIEAISPNKDVDGLTDLNTAKLYKAERCFIPCTPRAVLELIKKSGINIEGKHAVVVGRSNIVGKPAALLLLQNNATVTICHSKTQNLKEECRKADILIACVGKPNLITREYVKEGAVVIDVGTSRVDGKMVGDVCFEEVKEIASYITPVPGGVGSVTTTMLIKNTCDALVGDM